MLERACSSWWEDWGAMPASWARHGQRHSICVGTWNPLPAEAFVCLEQQNFALRPKPDSIILVQSWYAPLEMSRLSCGHPRTTQPAVRTQVPLLAAQVQCRTSEKSLGMGELPAWMHEVWNGPNGKWRGTIMHAKRHTRPDAKWFGRFGVALAMRELLSMQRTTCRARPPGHHVPAPYLRPPFFFPITYERRRSQHATLVP